MDKTITYEELAERLKKQPLFFSELLREYSTVEYRSFLLTWSELRRNYDLKRDKEGRYLL